MNIRKQVFKILLITHQPGFVSALPQTTEKTVSFVEASRDSALNSSHTSPQRCLAGLDHKMIMCGHQTEREYREFVKLFHILNRVYEALRFVINREYRLTACNPAIDVIYAF